MGKFDARTCTHPDRNPVVQRCCEARNRVLADCKGLAISDYTASCMGSEAFVAAMPDLTTIQEIKDYAACIAHGVVIGAVDGKQAPKLLSAAKLVLSALRFQPNEQNPAA